MTSTIKTNMIPAVLRFNKTRKAFFSEHYLPEKKMIIGLTGKAGSGKDTIAMNLVENYGFTRLAFAQPIKTANMSLFGLSPCQMEDRKLKESIIDPWGASPRDLNQWLATILRSKFGDDFFIKSMRSRMDNFKDNCIVISDCRFDNEAEFILNNGGVIWKVDTGERYIAEHMSDKAKSHITEKGVSEYLISKTIDNSGTIKETMEKLELNFLR